MPPGLRAWIGRDLCGSQPWVDFYGGLENAVKFFNVLDFPSALSALVNLLVAAVQDPHIAFDCATAVGATLTLAAQCCEQLQLPMLGTRLRQLAAIFSAFDYQMKGEDYIDRSPWPMNWMDSMEGILRSVTSLKQHELVVEPWRGVTARTALSQRLPPQHRGGGLRTSIGIVSVCDYNPEQTPLARLSELNKGTYADRYGYDVAIYEKAPIFKDPLSVLLTEPPSHRPAAWSKVDALLTALAAGKHDWLLWMDCDSFFMDQDVRLEDIVAMAEAQRPSEASGQRDREELRELVGRWEAGPRGRQRPEALLDWYDDLLDGHWRAAASWAGSGQDAHFPRNRTLGWEDWLFRERRFHLIASEDGLMLNTGIMLVRSSVWSWQFFQKVRWMTFGVSPVTQHPWWEQTAMVYLLQLPFTLAQVARQRLEDVGPAAAEHGYAPACLMLSQKHLNGYPPIVASALRTHATFEAGDFIVSFSGCKVYSSQEVCNQLFLGYFFQVHDIQAHMADPDLSSWL